MAYKKKNFRIDERVMFIRVDGALENRKGTVLAHLPTYGITDDYIIQFDEPLNGQKAIVITEACLEGA